MDKTVEWLKSCVADAQHDVFRDVVKVIDCRVEPIGDGQVIIFSDVNRVRLTLETSTGDTKHLQAISKLEATSKQAREFAVNLGAYTNETMMYGKVLKSMEKLLHEVGDNKLLWPECYICSDNNTFLLQDLTVINFKIVPTHMYLDLNHALIVMKNIGKFHGLSMVLKERGMLSDNFQVSPYYGRKDPFMDTMIHKYVTDLNQVIRTKWGPEWSSVPDRLSKYLENAGEKLYDAWLSSKGKWDVLNHGDFSMRNMLFHYQKDSSTPDDIKFVDFQMSHFSSLGNDLVICLYGSLKPSVRENNLNILLETYMNGLESITKSLNYKGKLPTLEDVKETIDSMATLQLFTILISVPLFVQSGKKDMQKETEHYMETIENSENMEEAIQNFQSDRNMFDDDDITEYLKTDFQRLINLKVF